MGSRARLAGYRRVFDHIAYVNITIFVGEDGFPAGERIAINWMSNIY